MVLELKDVVIDLDKKTIIDKINITIPKNKFVGLVGLNGTGKSTILKAIYGINKYKGTILLNNQDIKNFNTKALAQKMAVLIQENVNDFDFKVKDIVMLGRLPYKKLFDNDTADDFEIVNNALNYVGMQDFAERYFNSLSGGEKQRLCLARELLKNADVYILDESTSSLDTLSEKIILKSIKKIAENSTVIIITHKLANIKEADIIYVMDDGHICEYGQHQELMHKRGLYYNLYKQQN